MDGIADKSKKRKRHRIDRYKLDSMVRLLLDNALADYNVSKILLNQYDFHHYCTIVCYHCYQCVKKSLKAFLIFNKIEFSETNDLLVLLDLCHDFSFKKFNLSTFSGFGIDTLHEDVSLGIDEAEQAFMTAQSVMDYVKNSILLPINHDAKRIRRWKQQAQNRAINTAKNLLDIFDVETIAKRTKLTVEKVEELKKEYLKQSENN